MGLRLEDLVVARAFMIEEIDMDARNDQIYLSTYLTQSGQGQWADMLRAAAQNGNDDSLAAEITRAGILNVSGASAPFIGRLDIRGGDLGGAL
jgi:hypothetical protein